MPDNVRNDVRDDVRVNRMVMFRQRDIRISGLLRAIAPVCAILLCTLPIAAPVYAQGRDSLLSVRVEEVLVRVRRYTSSDVAQARALADSLVSALPADASVLPEALFAKASIAASASDAERDYARIVDQHQFAPRVPDALMRLALLESARNNRVGALRRLDQLLRDHGDAPVRSRASLLAGRLRMESNDPARACELLAAAYASAGNAERDVREQAVSLGTRCPTSIVVMAERDPTPMGVVRAPRENVATVATVAPPSAAQAEARRRRQRDSVLLVQREKQAVAAAAARAASPVSTPVTSRPVRRDSAATPAPMSRTPVASTTAAAASTVPSVASPSVRAAPSSVASSAASSLPAPSAASPSIRAASPASSASSAIASPPLSPSSAAPVPSPSMRAAAPGASLPQAAAATPTAVAPVERTSPLTSAPVVTSVPTPLPARAATPSPSASPGAPATSAMSASRFAVQFAAYNDRAGAAQFAEVLQRRGITARVEGNVKPFRVRAGRFTTRAEAEASAALWRRPGQAAIVVENGPTP